MNWTKAGFLILCLAFSRDVLGQEAVPTLSGAAPRGNLVPLILAGSPTDSPPDTPALRVDPNTTTSSFGGVGSVFIDAPPVNDNLGFLCSSCAIHGFTVGKRLVRDYVLMAAHCLDFQGGLDADMVSTGDGVADVAPQNVTFLLNVGGSFTSLISASEIHLHPNWHGFANELGPEGSSVNDDVALLRLASPVPLGVPVYNLAASISGFVERIEAVGYGRSGDPNGFTVPSSFDIKRTGFNQADIVFTDDELTGQLEVFEADFDGPDGATNFFDVGPPGFNPSIEGTLGNTLETTLGPGDSGGPSFLTTFSTGALQLGSDGQPIVFGLNTFGANNPPAFGSAFGGMLVAHYASWINSVMVPEPASAGLLFVCMLLVVSRWRRR